MCGRPLSNNEHVQVQEGDTTRSRPATSSWTLWTVEIWIARFQSHRAEHCRQRLIAVAPDAQACEAGQDENSRAVVILPAAGPIGLPAGR